MRRDVGNNVAAQRRTERTADQNAMKTSDSNEQPEAPTAVRSSDGLGTQASVLQAVEQRFDEMEEAALHAWNRMDSDDPERPYHEGFLAAVKYTRREYRRTLSAVLFGK